MTLLIGERASGFCRRAGQPARRPSWGALAVLFLITVSSTNQQDAIAQESATTSEPATADDAMAPSKTDKRPAAAPADQTAFVSLAESHQPFLDHFNLHDDRLRFIGLFSPS